MNAKTMLHKIPGGRWLDEFSDTPTGRIVMKPLTLFVWCLWLALLFRGGGQ